MGFFWMGEGRIPGSKDPRGRGQGSRKMKAEFIQVAEGLGSGAMRIPELQGRGTRDQERSDFPGAEWLDLWRAEFPGRGFLGGRFPEDRDRLARGLGLGWGY